MKFKLGFGLSSWVALLAIAGIAPAAMAGDNPMFYGTTAEALEAGFFQHGQNSLKSNSLWNQWIRISGASSFPRGGFPEIAIERDNRNVNAIYRDAMVQQTMSDPYMRVPDLPNPYNTSLMTLPSLQTGRVVGTELVYDRFPTP